MSPHAESRHPLGPFMPNAIHSLQEANAKRWAAAKLTRSSEYHTPVLRAIAAKDRYKAIQSATGVHWVFIAVTHYRECSQNFSQSLAQGDDWSRVSRHVPKNRGPFHSFEEAAVDALVKCPPYAAHNHDWSMPNMLTLLEAYNGLGYCHRGVPSPYVWSGTDQYHSGKYVSDGVYDPHVVDRQLGVAGFIICLVSADPTISFTGLEKPVDALNLTTSTTPTPLPDKAPEGVLQDVWDWMKEH